MEKRPSRELRQTAHLDLRKHFIGHRRVCNKGTALFLNAFFRPCLIYKHCDIVSKQGAQVAGMYTFLSCHQGITHLLVHLVHSCTYRRDETSAGHRDIDGVQGNSLFRKEVSDGITTHRRLIHH